jgi:serine/threonine protein kinase/WD40 repeat protein
MTPCPSDEQLKRLLAEQLPDEEREAAKDHVEACPACQHTLARLSDQAAGIDWELLRGSRAAVGTHADIVRRLEQTPPSGEPGTQPSPEGDPGPIAFEGAPTDKGPLGQLDSLHIRRELGRGRYGVVYEAVDELDRLVAVKVLKPQLAGDPCERARFEREARKAAAVRHDHIVTVYHVGHAPSLGLPYLVMEYLEGETLAARLRREGALSPKEAAEIVRQVASGLAAAHVCGLVHRDVKPSNILLEAGSGRAKLTDFGLARATEPGSVASQSGAVVGTPAYMSPEQVTAPGKVDGRSDVYSLGVVLYEALTGERPFSGLPHLVLDQVVHDEPRAPRRLNDAVPRDLETITLKCLAKEPERRYPSAEDLAEDLGRFLAGRPIQARRSSLWERGVKWARRRPALAALVTVSAAAILSLLGGTLWHNAQLGGANAELDAALRKSEDRRIEAETKRVEANTNLYHSLIGEVRALRLARVAGYRQQAWDRLQQALRLETPAKDKEQLRQEAATWLGDFIGPEPTTWEDVPAGISCGALHPDGTQLAVGLLDGTVLLRRIPGGAHIATLKGHSAAVSALIFRADGKELVSTDKAGKVKVWQCNAMGPWTCKTLAVEPVLVLLTPSLTFPFFTPTFRPRSIDVTALTSDGRYLAVCSWRESRIALVDLEAGTTTARFVAPEGEEIRPGALFWALMKNMAFSPDGKLLAAGYVHKGTYGVLVWDVGTRQLKKRILPELEETLGVSFSPDGKLLACLGSGGLALYDTSTFQRRQVVRGDMPYRVAFSPDSLVLAVHASHLGLIRFLNISTSREVAALGCWHGEPGDYYLTFMEFSRDGKFFAAGTRQSVRIWNLAGAGEKLTLRGHGGGVPQVVFSPDGKLLASVGRDSKIIIWDPLKGNIIKELTEFSTPVQSLCFSPDGRVMAAGDSETGTVRFYDIESWSELYEMQAEVGGIVWCIAFSPDGQSFAAGGSSGLMLWRVARGNGDQRAGKTISFKALGRLPDQAGSICFSADGKWLVSVHVQRAQDQTFHHWVNLWDSHSSQAHSLSMAQPYYHALALSFYPDSKHVAFVNGKKAIAVWDVTTRREAFSFGEGELERRGGLIPHTRLSADGAWYAVGGRAVTVWDMAAKKLLVTLPEERGAIWGIDWSPNRELLAVGTSSGNVVIWNLSKVNAQLAEIGLGW